MTKLQVKDNKTGEVQDINEVDLPAMAKNDISIPKGEYEFEDNEGQKFKVPATSVKNAVDAGWKFRDQDTIQHEKNMEKYGNQEGKSLALAILRGGTLGLSDVGLTKTGLVTAEEIKGLQEANPIISTVGEIGGNIAPIVLSGGSGLLAKASSVLPSAIVESVTAQMGKRAVQNVTSEVAKKALSFVASGAAEGAVMGVTKSISEAALGDHEFNAESVLSNVGTGILLGGGTAGVFGIGAGVLDKATRGAKKQALETVMNQVGASAEIKAGIRQKIETGQALDAAEDILKDKAVIEFASKHGAPTTRAMTSNVKPLQEVEGFLLRSPTEEGELIRKKAQEIAEFSDNFVADTFSGAKLHTPEEAGDLIKQRVTTGIDSQYRPAQLKYEELISQVGDAPINRSLRTRVSNEIKKSDQYRIGKSSSSVKNIIDNLDDEVPLTFNQMLSLRKGVDAEMRGLRVASRSGTPEFNALSEIRDRLKTMERNAIKGSLSDNFIGANKAKGKELGEKMVEAYDAVNKEYVGTYKYAQKMADNLGMGKVGSLEDFLDRLDKMSSVDFSKRIFNTKKTDVAKKLIEDFPEIGEIALAVKQRDLLTSVTNKDGGIMYDSLARKVQRMTPEERSLYFGQSKEVEKNFFDFLDYRKKAPKDINPSGTDVRNEIRSLFNPKETIERWALGKFYRGGDDYLDGFVTKTLPILSSVEKSANNTKNTISNAVNGFYKIATPAVVTAGFNLIPEKKQEKATSIYNKIQSDPQQIIDDFTRKNKDLYSSAPNTATALQQKLLSAIAFLKEKAPGPSGEYINEQFKPSKSKVMEFSDYLDAIEKPKRIVEQLKNGYVNPRGVEALKYVYPKIFQAIQAELTAKMPKNLSMSQRTQLQIILGSKVNPALDPENFAVLQGQQAGQTQQQSAQVAKPRVSGLAKSEIAGREQGSFARVVNRS